MRRKRIKTSATLAFLGITALAAEVTWAQCPPGDTPAVNWGYGGSDDLSGNNEKYIKPGQDLCVPKESKSALAREKYKGVLEVYDPKNPAAKYIIAESALYQHDGSSDKRRAALEKAKKRAAEAETKSFCETDKGDSRDASGSPSAPHGIQVPPGDHLASPALPSLAESRAAGSTHNGEIPVQPITPGNLGSVRNAAALAEQARVNEFLDNALKRRQAIRESAEHDTAVLSSKYKAMDLQELDSHYSRAEAGLNKMLQDLSSTKPGQNSMDPGELIRFQNIYRNARDKAAAAREIVKESLASGDTSKNAGSALTKNAALNDLFSGSYAATSQDALLDRLIMMNGLDEADRQSALARLRLLEKQKLRLANGKSKIVPILHNGYIFGAGKSGTDCSSFVSSALPVDIRKGNFTTLDLQAMWQLNKSGEMPKPPKWSKEREKLVEKTAKAFLPVDLYMGEKPVPGDMLVYRLPWKAAGHVFLVKDYDPKTMVARVLEAAQSAGTIRERDFPLSFDPPSHAIRMVRPGFVDLRLKPVDNSVCKYQDRRNRSKPGARKQAGTHEKP
ncbi:MAG: hypothetical protein A2X94_16100 [Bdellovibrionales bacterium GWB1_55_8]|nr:MAG: hypothetical protein A2X94_16100 [Bdellovibrionales bacterium GWB1_55_8]